jgi:DNA/RNA-binding domain of Phe-tRNA-synthetase-like protein
MQGYPAQSHSVMLTVDPHPLLDLRAFVTEFPRPVGELQTTPDVLGLLSLAGQAPLQSSDDVSAAVRDLLRHGGFKPTGRCKPASEYLIRAANEGTFASINVAVDVGNAVSLHSGLPISVVDLDLVCEPLRVGIAPQGAAYVFNTAGQTIDIGGLLCLFDATEPCASAVKDSQRTKTRRETRQTLSLIWRTRQLPGRAADTDSWYRDLLRNHRARVEGQNVL